VGVAVGGSVGSAAGALGDGWGQVQLAASNNTIAPSPSLDNAGMAANAIGEVLRFMTNLLWIKEHAVALRLMRKEAVCQ
jgi:hypothetical protein